MHYCCLTNTIIAINSIWTCQRNRFTVVELTRWRKTEYFPPSETITQIKEDNVIRKRGREIARPIDPVTCHTYLRLIYQNQPDRFMLRPSLQFCLSGLQLLVQIQNWTRKLTGKLELAIDYTPLVFSVR